MIPHKKYMQQAIKLARKAGRNAAPNPRVGCILVKRGQVIGRGYHKEYGAPHAEQMALEQAEHKAKDAIMYITLEPCSHWGKTPACTEKIVQAGVKEVVIGMHDPNLAVSGYEIVKQRGVKARIGLLEEECIKLNEDYVKYVKKKLPFVTLKAGMTLDGKIATSGGKSKYITGKESLTHVHKMRDEIGTIMVGVNTIIKDDPLLDARHTKGKEPKKLIIDSSLKIPPKAKVLKKPEMVIVAHTDKAAKKRKAVLEKLGVTLIETKVKDGGVDLKKVMRQLAKQGIINVLLEGGSKLNASMLKAKLVDKVMLFASPKLLGDDGLGVIGDLGIKDLDKMFKLKKVQTKRLGDDILVSGYINVPKI